MRGDPLRAALARKRRRMHPPDQVGNAFDTPAALASVTPPSEVPAQQVHSDWDPLREGQDVPLIGERTVCPDDLWDD